MREYNWKLIRICSRCRKEYEQGIENYFYYQAISKENKNIVIPNQMLMQEWQCSDCILEIAREERS